MSNFDERLSDLSPAKRKLLLQRVRKEAADKPEAGAQTPSLRPVPRTADMPLSFAQQRLWFLEQLDPGNPVYNISGEVRLRGELDLESLERSFNAVVGRHESLRTTFPAVEGRVAQSVAPPTRARLPVRQIHPGNKAEQDAEVLRLAQEEAQLPFDLARGPLLRSSLLRLSERDHVLLITMHHIVSDGWSVGIFIRELAAFYEAFTRGASAAMRELPIQYADYAQWQRNWLAGETLQEHLEYWKQQLQDLPPTELPADRPRPEVRALRGQQLTRTIPPETIDRLKSLSAQEGVTLFITLLAAFDVLLSRYTGQVDMVVGTPVANRNRPEVQSLIGLFVNTLVLRTDLAGDPTLRQLLGVVRDVTLDAYAHQDVPFERLVEELQPRRDVGYNPLFQVMFTLYNDVVPAVELPGLSLEFIYVDNYTAKFDLSVSVLETHEGYLASFEFDTGLFDEATVARFATHYLRLLRAIVDDPGRRISEFPLLAEEEHDALLQLGWGSKVAYEPATLHGLFEARAALVPDVVAVEAGGERLTYAELNARAERLARRLRSLGVGPEVMVGVMADRSIWAVVAVLGVLKAGGAYVPLNAAYPSRRLALMREDAGIELVVAQREAADALPPNEAQIVVLDDDSEPDAPLGADRLADSVTPDNTAYVIYTSGSTGKPKGVMVSHQAVANFLQSMQQRPGFKTHDVLLAVTTLSFDIAALELFLPLVAGGLVVIAGREDTADGARLAALLSESGATMMQATPATWRLLVDSGWQGTDGLRILCGGEALPRDLADKLLERGGALWNMYGPTETTIWSLVNQVDSGQGAVPLGHPIANTQAYILDGRGRLAPTGVPGELCLGGAGLARGYLNRPALTAERFVPDPFSGGPGARLYRTGDLARYGSDGALEFMGRLDHQVKIRGHRIELGEVEAALREHGQVRDCVVVARRGPGDGLLLAAYVVLRERSGSISGELQAFLREQLPEHMVPSQFVMLEQLPLTPSGKLDRASLPEPGVGMAGAKAAVYTAPRTQTEREVVRIWAEVLETEQVGLDDNFFDLGGHSLLLAQVHAKLRQKIAPELAMIDLFKYPTVRALVQYLIGGAKAESSPPAPLAPERETEIAVIGMQCRLPGAKDVDEFWRNLCNGVESVTFFSDEELHASRVPQSLLHDPRYVKARAVVADVELFDAEFFGYSDREAEVIDPQQRLFLECSWAALEDAGYDTETYRNPIGVFAGVGGNTYLIHNLLPNFSKLEGLGSFQMMIANDKDYLSTRVSYGLDLEGPSIVVQTACSTSLVAVHLACQSLINRECDMALTGASSLRVPHRVGYLYLAGGIHSPDGHCRAFDADAAGIVEGNGVGVIVLKRLSDALADGDHVYAVIKGSAINNDGARKVGYTAPRVDGQAKVIAASQRIAGVDANTINYVETHGTGTALGDPIEIAALTQAFRATTDEKGFCAIGSVKTNIGHADTAAGVAGMIKTVLALSHRMIPPSLNFERPNPQIDFAGSPFYVNTKLRPWEPGLTPGRAGVSSFGIGGTNAHVILEEPPAVAESGAARPRQLLILSAKNERALDQATNALAERLEQESERHAVGEWLEAEFLADVAYTLQVGRRQMPYRRAVVCDGLAAAIAALRGEGSLRVSTRLVERTERPVVFMFPGVSSQYAGMAAGLYATEPIFRQEIDRCAETLKHLTNGDLREMFRQRDPGEASQEILRRTTVAMPSIFVVEHALAKLWMSWGLKPEAMIGHSLGEYVAAVLSGVFALEDALALVALRGRLFEALPSGAMLSINLPEETVRALVPDGQLSLAAVNGPASCVVSGTLNAVAEFETSLAGRGFEYRRLHIDMGGHSHLVEPIKQEFTEFVEGLTLRAPTVPFISSVTGDWISAAEATDPNYWTRHLRETVRFADGVEELLKDPDRILLEVGPGQTLSTLVKLQAGGSAEVDVLSSLRHPYDSQPDDAFLFNTLAQLWLAGARFDWHGVHAHEARRRVSLPGYPFQRQRYWIDPPDLVSAALGSSLVVLPEEGARVASTPLQLHARRRLSSEYIAPANEIELALTEIWRELLGVEQVGNRDNFFELGGHSLLATQLASRVRDIFNVELPLRSLYENPVVEKLAEVISQAREGVAAGVDRISRGGPEEMLKGLDEMNAEEVSSLLRQMLEAEEVMEDEVRND